jgi:hypothetical protein
MHVAQVVRHTTSRSINTPEYYFLEYPGAGHWVNANPRWHHSNLIVLHMSLLAAGDKSRAQASGSGRFDQAFV